MGVGVLIVLFIISLAFSSSEPYEKFGVDASLSLEVGAGLILLYIMLLLSFSMAIVLEVSKIFKK